MRARRLVEFGTTRPIAVTPINGCSRSEIVWKSIRGWSCNCRACLVVVEWGQAMFAFTSKYSVQRGRSMCNYFSRVFHLSVVAWASVLVLCALMPIAARAETGPQLAMTPPMGWSDWAHYQCDYTAKTILQNARALVRTGLAAKGYDHVSIDDCWLRRHRGANGNLLPNPRRFPHGIAIVSREIHSLGLKFGIYEDEGYATCAGYAGSGVPLGGGKPHFLQDAKLFEKWKVSYLKIDGCNVYVPKGESRYQAARAGYRDEMLALQKISRPIVYLEEGPVYFQGTREYYNVLTWARKYSQLWRTGSDIAIYDRNHPNRSRFPSIMWNYDYNIELGRFQKPGRWDNPDFVIGGDHGVSVAATKTQMALWSMMSAPLVLSSDIGKLSRNSVRILGNRAVIAVDQDPLGRMATLVKRTPVIDLLFKPLVNHAYAVAVLNRSRKPVEVVVHPSELGFEGAGCRFASHNLWSGMRRGDAHLLAARIGRHDTSIWKIRPNARCGRPRRIGVITRIVPWFMANHLLAEDYSRCLSAPGKVGRCVGSESQSWRVTRTGVLKANGECLAESGDKAVMEKCRNWSTQRWSYNLLGNLINRATRLCLTGPRTGTLSVQVCGDNLASQIWSLPNGVGLHRRLM